MAASLGEMFARALAAKDFDRLVSLLHPEVDFRGMTPGRFWEASNAVQAVDEIVRSWFEDSDQIDELLQVETSRVADRERVGYRLAVDGKRARWARSADHELTVIPQRHLKKGKRFTTVVRYDGVPMTQIDLSIPEEPLPYGWIHTDDGADVVSEPEGSANWFPRGPRST